RQLLASPPDRGHTGVPALRRGGPRRPGPVPRLRPRVPARRAPGLRPPRADPVGRLQRGLRAPHVGVRDRGGGVARARARVRGRREVWSGLGIFAAVMAACFLPFVILSPGGVAHSIGTQLGRPLQIESLGASLLLAAEQLGLYDATVVNSHGSQNLAGSLPDALASIQTAFQVVAVGVVWALFAARERGREGLIVAFAGAVAAFVAFGKVLSPQFLIWLLPLVPAVAGATGLAASGV